MNKANFTKKSIFGLISLVFDTESGQGLAYSIDGFLNIALDLVVWVLVLNIRSQICFTSSHFMQLVLLSVRVFRLGSAITAKLLQRVVRPYFMVSFNE